MSPHLFPPKNICLSGANRMETTISDLSPPCQTKNLVFELDIENKQFSGFDISY